MAFTQPVIDTKILSDAIRKAITEQADAAFETLKADLIKKLENEKAAIIGGVAIDVMKLVKFETMMDNLVLTIVKKP